MMFWNRKKKLQKIFPEVQYERQNMIGSHLNFAAAEAYKLLRTNLTFSFAEDESCRVIGVTSALKGEGKSLTAINLGYAFAETGKKVLLVECDMRMPTVAKRLKISPAPGLSNLIVGTNSVNEIIQKSVLLETLDVLPAGDIPPNASELLGSARMKYAVDKMGEYYDYIILDLPPVMAVSDTLIASRLTSGMILVVRQDFAGKAALAETMRQMKYANAKVLGFVFNSVDTADTIYHKQYRKSYGNGRCGYSKYGYAEWEDKKEN